MQPATRQLVRHDYPIVIRNLWMSFAGKRGGQPVHVLEDINVEIRRGEFVCFVGPSGCGKSTLLNIVGGFLVPSRGAVLVEDEPVRGPDPRRIFVFQENGVFPWLTVQDNIGFGLLRKSAAERKRIVEHYTEMVGLVGFERSYPRELSGGMRQRVELARALAANPDIIYMDEPFGALDFLTRLKMRADLVRIWQEERKTILFVTHDIEEAVQLADRVLVMSQRPATIQTIVEIPLPRPRDLDSPDYLKARDRIFQTMGMSLRVGESVAPASVSPPSAPAAQGGGPAAVVRNLPDRSAISNDPLDAEVIIIGAGPAGSVLGAYLARAGIDHLIIEKAVHPRPHVGESLVCSTTRVFQEIDFLKVMEREGFVRKHGANWYHWADSRPCTIRFGEIPELGIVQDYTYHVDRGRFDQLLLEHAAARGSRVLQGVHVERVEFGPGGEAVGVRVRDRAGERVLRCQLVVDASGRNTILGAQLRLKRRDPLFNQFAVHNWFEGIERGEADTTNFIHCYILPGPRSWAWQIPINPTVTSVGVVTAQEEFVKAGEDVAEFFAKQIAGNPVLCERMRGARPLHLYQREGNYSYVMERFSGDGWLLVGDAARFVDPVFASGVSVALESARRAAEAIVAALGRGEVSAAGFASYETAMRTGVDIWREFIVLYYRLPPLFLDLITQPAHRLQVLRLLQGDVYDRRTVPILARMRQEIERVERRGDHPWKPHLDLSVPLPDIAGSARS